MKTIRKFKHDIHNSGLGKSNIFMAKRSLAEDHSNHEAYASHKKKAVIRKLARFIISALSAHATPLTANEIYFIIHANSLVDKYKYTIRSIENELNDYSDSKNNSTKLSDDSNVYWPILFERVTGTRPNKWVMIDQQQSKQYGDDLEANYEIDRQIRLGKLASRSGQREFSRLIRRNYGGKCAITGCCTSKALEAAHIRVFDKKDDNSAHNGILLRADIHALFDALLFTFTPDGKGLEISSKLTDPSYAFLRKVKVAAPSDGPPSKDNIEDHRARFLEREKSIVKDGTS